MKNRVIWKMFALEIVTLGIYRLYWLLKTRKEMMQSDKDIKIMHPVVLFLPIIIVFISLIAFFITGIQAESKLPAYCSQYANSISTPKECEASPAIWAIVFFVVSIIFIAPLIVVWLWGFAKGVEKITKEKMSFPIALLILYVVPDGIDILLVQDAFNKIEAPASN